MSDWRTVTSDEGATFEPYTDGYAVGFKVTAPGKPTRFIYLNPSLATDTGDINDSDVFLYHGPFEPDTQENEPICYVNIWEPE